MIITAADIDASYFVYSESQNGVLLIEKGLLGYLNKLKEI